MKLPLSWLREYAPVEVSDRTGRGGPAADRGRPGGRVRRAGRPRHQRRRRGQGAGHRGAGRVQEADPVLPRHDQGRRRATPATLSAWTRRAAPARTRGTRTQSATTPSGRRMRTPPRTRRRGHGHGLGRRHLRGHLRRDQLRGRGPGRAGQARRGAARRLRDRRAEDLRPRVGGHDLRRRRARHRHRPLRHPGAARRRPARRGLRPLRRPARRGARHRRDPGPRRLRVRARRRPRAGDRVRRAVHRPGRRGAARRTPGSAPTWAGCPGTSARPASPTRPRATGSCCARCGTSTPGRRRRCGCASGWPVPASGPSPSRWT